MDRQKAVRIIVRGIVQGVFFRSSTRETAIALGLTGWVRNLADGSVELVAEGDPVRVQELVAWCRHGPPMAMVSEIEVIPIEPPGLVGFSVSR